MTSSAQLMRQYTGLALFSFGFRPFFLAGAIAAAMIPVVTALAFSGAITFNFAGGVIAWHSHEMIYGYLSAIVAGFILTAVPNWTGRLPLLGARLGGLFFLWYAGRVAVFMSDQVNGFIVGLVDVSSLFMLDVFLWREVLHGKNWRNAPVCALVLLFAIGNAVWHWQALQGGNAAQGLYFGIAVIAILLALIGGRVTPSFTRNWLAKTGREAFEASFSLLDKAAIVVLVFSILMWLVAPRFGLTGAALVIAAGLHFVRLTRWRGWRTGAEPLVLILHIGYFWLPVSLLLLGLSVFASAAFPAVVALHALTAGAAGVMTLAVMTRATLGHTGRPLSADTATIVIYALVNLGAAIRVLAFFLPLPYAMTIAVSSLIWGGAFALFAIVYGRYLLAPRPARDA